MHVVNQSQQVYTIGLSPMAAYSRIITVRASAAGDGTFGHGVSPVLGQRLWLLKVNVTMQVQVGAEFARTHFSIHRGTGDAPTRQNVQAWEHIIDFGTYAGFNGMVVYGNWRQFTWDFQKLFTTEANRLGVVIYNTSSGVAVVHVFFKVSEG